MAEETELKFSSLQEELQHWRETSKKYKKSYECALEELIDFQSSSKELELELEAQLTQSDHSRKDLKIRCSKLQDELETLQNKYESLQKSSISQISKLETNLLRLEEYKDDLQKYIRELEQTNDDLERSKRAAVVSLEDFEYRLNQAIERNAFLESELDEKENNFLVSVQRLKDEARDLSQELAVQKKREAALVESPSLSPDQANQTCSKEINQYQTKDLEVYNRAVLVNRSTSIGPFENVFHFDKENSLKNQLAERKNKSEYIQNHIGTLTEVSESISPVLKTDIEKTAKAMVGELMNIVGSMERKLSSCQSLQILQQKHNNEKNTVAGSVYPYSNAYSSKRFTSSSGTSIQSTPATPSNFVQITV